MANTGLGVTIGSHSLRAVKLRRKGPESFVIQGVFSERLDDSTRPVAGRALAARGFRGTPATVGLTGREMIIRYTQVPPVPDWRLRTLMKFEIDEVGTQSGGDVSADYKKLDLPDPEGEREDDTILVALARNTHLDALIQSLDSGGLRFGEGCPNSVALFNAFAVNATYTETEVALLVNIGAENVDIAVQQGGELIFARNATPGGQAFTDAVRTAFSTTESKAEKMKRTKGDVTPKGEAHYPDPTSEKVANAMIGVAGQLASMIQSTLMIAKAQTRTPDLKVDRVLLAGGGASLNGLDRYLGQAMGVPVEKFNPLALCDTRGLSPEELALLEDAPHEFAVAIGLAQNALSPATFRLAVLPAALKRVRDFVTKGIWAVAAAAVMVGVLVFIYLARDAAATETASQIGGVKSTSAKADTADKKMRTALAKAQDMAVKHELLAQRAAPGAMLADVVTLLDAILTDTSLQQVYITKIELDVTDNNHSFTEWLPKGKVASGYEEFTHVRKANQARESEVSVTGAIGGGRGAPALYQDFYQACRSNGLGLVVEAPSGFRAGRTDRDGTFELLFRAGTMLQLSDTDGKSGTVIVRDIALDDYEDPKAFVGIRVDGSPMSVPINRVERARAKRLTKRLQEEHRAAADSGEGS